jgi:hypothetical protein
MKARHVFFALTAFALCLTMYAGATRIAHSGADLTRSRAEYALLSDTLHDVRTDLRHCQFHRRLLLGME